MVEMIWKEPPPLVSSEKAATLAELQKNPGRWALVQARYKSTSGTTAWKKLGCEATHRRAEPSVGATSPEYDIYARWPEKGAGAKSSSAVIPAQPKAAEVAKAISTGTALKPPASAPRPSLPAPKNSGGYSQFLANQRAGISAPAE